jgi:hypothetical protein
MAFATITPQILGDICKKANDENRSCLRVSLDTPGKGDADTIYLSVEYESEKDKFIPINDITINSIILSSAANPRKESKNAPTYVQTSIMNVDKEFLKTTDWTADKHDKIISNTNDLISASIEVEKQLIIAIQRDLLNNRKVLAVKKISIPNTKINSYIQTSRKASATDDINSIGNDGKIALSKPILRIRADINKATGKIGYLKKETKDFNYIFFKSVKDTTGKNVQQILKIFNKETNEYDDLNAINSKHAVTYMSVVSGKIRLSIVISSQGISMTLKYKQTLVFTHKIRKNAIDQELLDEIDDYGSSVSEPSFGPNDEKVEVKQQSNNRPASVAQIAVSSDEKGINGTAEPDENLMDDSKAEEEQDNAEQSADTDQQPTDESPAEPEPEPEPTPPPKPVVAAPKKPLKPINKK